MNESMIMLDNYGKIFRYNLSNNKMDRVTRNKDYKTILDGLYDNKS